MAKKWKADVLCQARRPYQVTHLNHDLQFCQTDVAMQHWVCLSRCMQKNSNRHHHQRIANPHRLRLGGRSSKVHQLAEATSLPKQEQSHLSCGSTAPTSSNCSSNLEASARLCAKNLAQRLYLQLELQTFSSEVKMS